MGKRTRKMRRVEFKPEDGKPKRAEVVMRERHLKVITRAATREQVGISRYFLDAAMEKAEEKGP